MAADLRERLQASLGRAYTIERELGGGGMSRVFVADETSLGRKVVIKVLPPELSAGVNVDRFKREIQVAARLQRGSGAGGTASRRATDVVVRSRTCGYGPTRPPCLRTRRLDDHAV